MISLIKSKEIHVSISNLYGLCLFKINTYIQDIKILSIKNSSKNHSKILLNIFNTYILIFNVYFKHMTLHLIHKIKTN